MDLNFLEKLRSAKNGATSYHVGLLQTKVYRALKSHTTKVLEPYGISPTHWALLGVLYEQPEGIRSSELAGILGVEAPFVTSMIDDLSSKSIIDKVEDKQDRRAKIIKLNKSGKDFVNKTEKIVRQETSGLLKDVSYKDLYTYLKVINKIVNNYEKE